MPYLPDFATDLFISYSHLDNQDDPPWITRLHKDLGRRLSQYLGKTVEIWRDCRLQGNELLTPAIEEQLRQVAIMVSVISPRYFLSEWCQRELQAFLDSAASHAWQGGSQSRLFKVVETPVEDPQPARIRDLLGYDFYRRDEERGTPRRMPDRDPRSDAERIYLAKLDDVAYDIYRLLKQMGESPCSSDKPDNRKVYLAETSFDMTPNRDQIRRELLSQGFQVFPDHDLPRENGKVIETVTRALESCALSIHMIGAGYGFVPDGSTRSVVWIQQELAACRQHRHDKFCCLVWMPPGLEVTNLLQRESISQLHEQLREQNRFELLNTPLEELKKYIVDRLTPEPAISPHHPVHGRRVYLICETRDFPAIEQIRQCLFDSGASVDWPLREGSQDVIRLEHEAALQECDGVLIYYGGGSEGWVREKTRELRKSRGQGRSRPFSPQGIYIAPESTEAKQSYINPEFIVMRNFGAFTCDSLRPFLDELQHAEASAASGVGG